MRGLRGGHHRATPAAQLQGRQAPLGHAHSGHQSAATTALLPATRDHLPPGQQTAPPTAVGSQQWTLGLQRQALRLSHPTQMDLPWLLSAWLQRRWKAVGHRCLLLCHPHRRRAASAWQLPGRPPILKLAAPDPVLPPLQFPPWHQELRRLLPASLHLAWEQGGWQPLHHLLLSMQLQDRLFGSLYLQTKARFPEPQSDILAVPALMAAQALILWYPYQQGALGHHWR
mmetsp:Transcript_5527/g.15856  ORF Transcript_5527/g.15856 Transcript_5527/m.15856 type:complete len:228 (+) Transcript_5527:808-1491(+)